MEPLWRSSAQSGPDCLNLLDKISVEMVWTGLVFRAPSLLDPPNSFRGTDSFQQETKMATYVFLKAFLVSLLFPALS